MMLISNVMVRILVTFAMGDCRDEKYASNPVSLFPFLRQPKSCTQGKSPLMTCKKTYKPYIFQGREKTGKGKETYKLDIKTALLITLTILRILTIR